MVKILNWFKPKVEDADSGKPKDIDGYYIDSCDIKNECVVGFVELQNCYFTNINTAFKMVTVI